MRYPDVTAAVFLQRPNRFIAHCLVEGQPVIAHVPNTGRCRELLIPGCTVYLSRSQNPRRKTPYTLICVEKGNLLINMDSQAPNRVTEEALKSGVLQLTRQPALAVKREVFFGESRLDFMVEAPEERAFVEVKGVTLEENGEVRFPDAPTLRGLRHMEELEKAVEQGYTAHVLFVVQMARADYFRPNDATQPQFGQMLRHIAKFGVGMSAYLCSTSPDELSLSTPIPIRLN